MMVGIEYRINPSVSSEALNELFASAWDAHTAKDFAAQLREASRAEDEGKYSPETVWTALKAKNAADPAKAARYPLSYDKVMRMWRKLIRDQFVNFAEA